MPAGVTSESVLRLSDHAKPESKLAGVYAFEVLALPKDAFSSHVW